MIGIALTIAGFAYCAATTVWIGRGMPEGWPPPWGTWRRRNRNAERNTLA